MSRSIKITDNIEICVEETTVEESSCTVCYYGRDGNKLKPESQWICRKLKDPRNPARRFNMFCIDKLKDNEYPCKGTLDLLERLFNTTVIEAIDSINNYCNKYCILVCNKDCPLYIWNQNKEEI